MEGLAIEVLLANGFAVARGTAPVGGGVRDRWGFEVGTSDSVVVGFGGDTVFWGKVASAHCFSRV